MGRVGRTPKESNPKWEGRMYISQDGPAWRALLANDDSVAITKIPRIIIKFDAVHQHTTYYRTLTDALTENSRVMTAEKLMQLNDRKVTTLEQGVWMGVYYTPGPTKIGKNAIRIAITEHIYPSPHDASETALFLGIQGHIIRNPVPADVAKTQTPVTRFSIWPKREFVAEYYGVTLDAIKPWLKPTRKTLPRLIHETGLIYYLDMKILPAMECLPLIQAGTWEFFIPAGESPEYWRSEYTPPRDFRGLGFAESLRWKHKRVSKNTRGARSLADIDQLLDIEQLLHMPKN